MTLKDNFLKWLLQNAITKFLQDVRKDKNKMNFLNGKKTYLVAFVLLAVGALTALGIPVPGFSDDPGTAFAAAIGLITGRIGSKNDVRKITGD